MKERLSKFFSMIHILLNVAQVAPYALRMIKSMATPFHVRTLCELLLVIDPSNKMNIIKVLNKIVENKIPEQVFTEAFTENQEIIKLEQKPVFSGSISNTFAKFLYEYAFKIRVGACKAKGMYSVSRQLIVLMLKSCDKMELEAGLELSINMLKDVN